jgi:hypothetical protein
MAAEKAPIDIAHARRFETELQTLYARRSAIDSLIESLKDYDRYRARRIEERELKTA